MKLLFEVLKGNFNRFSVSRGTYRSPNHQPQKQEADWVLAVLVGWLTSTLHTIQKSPQVVFTGKYGVPVCSALSGKYGAIALKVWNAIKKARTLEICLFVL
jgi:hypothetical protein